MRASTEAVRGDARGDHRGLGVITVHHQWLETFGLLIAAVAMSYAILAVLVSGLPSKRSRGAVATGVPVCILKPLCGAEPETYACLRSFCQQDYPEFQIVFGVSDADDPALTVVRRLQVEFPHLDLQITVDRRQHGSNRKISNLINMMPLVRHDVLVLSDSDVRVAADYIRTVVAPLTDPSVGIVTCAYRGVARPGLWSLLGSMYINEWFMPSVRVAAATGSRSFAFGASIVIRRQVLAKLGGFMALANQLADDYRLGELTRRMGLRTVLSDVVVETYVGEPTLSSLAHHELRWLRTIRALRPVGYGLCFITFGVPVTVLVCLLTHGATPALAMLAVTAVARGMLHVTLPNVTARRSTPWTLALLALSLRDFLSLALWCWSFTTRRVQWREDRYHINRDGSALPIVRIET